MSAAELNELLADGLMTIPEAVEFSGLSRSSLYVAMDRGEVPSVRRMGRRLIPRRGMVKFLAAGLIGSQEQSSREGGPAAVGV